MTQPLISLFLPNLEAGGAERVILHLANGLAPRNVQVELILAQARGAYLGQVDPVVQVVDLGVSRIASSVPALARHLRRQRPVALVSAMTHVNLASVLACGIARVPTKVIVTLHDTLSTQLAQLSFVPRTMLRMMAIVSCLGADRVVAVSHGVANDMHVCTGISLSKIKTIYNPVITQGLFDKALEAVKHPWLAHGGSPVLLAVGRLNQTKDFATLIRALAKMRHRDARLIILGEGSERKALEALVAELGLSQRVDLPGFVPNPYAYMARARLFVLSSKSEGLPTVLIEALSLGVPIVSTDCPSGPREILSDGRYGTIVPVADPEALALAMDTALEGESCPVPEQAYTDYLLDTAVSKYLRLLDL